MQQYTKGALTTARRPCGQRRAISRSGAFGPAYHASLGSGLLTKDLHVVLLWLVYMRVSLWGMHRFR